MASVYSGAGDGRYGTVQVRGQVEFGMQYNYKQGALEIHVVQCKDLAAVDSKRNRSDPYVKVNFFTFQLLNDILIILYFSYTCYQIKQRVENEKPKSRSIHSIQFLMNH